MSNASTKSPSQQSSDNALRLAFNDQDNTLAVGSFVTSKAGHKITLTLVDSVTEDYSYLDDSVLLMVLRVIYTDGTKATLSSVERIV